MKHLLAAAPISLLILAFSCTEAETETEPDDSCESHADCSGKTPYCDVDSCEKAPPGSELGWGDGTASSVTLTVILEDASLKRPTDLAFNPSLPNQLWVVNYQDDSTVIITDPGEATMTFERRKDPAASHFMRKPPAIAMGSVDETWGQTFGVCGDGDNGGDDFMGPALFSADLNVYAQQTPTGLGSHLDMLHSTTFCRGMAHVEANAYFVFNSDKGSLDWYNFAHDHDPGNDDHSDGEIMRYVEGQVAGVDGLQSHLIFEPDTRQLYVADTGNGRVLALDTQSGAIGVGFGGLELTALRKKVDGATLAEIVAPGTLVAPSGIELNRGLILVSDNATSKFHAFEKDGTQVNELATDLPAGSLTGFQVGPDGKVYFVDNAAGRVLRIDVIKE